MWWKYYVLMYKNGEKRHVETIPGMRGRGYNGEWWRVWIQWWYIVRTFANITMYPKYSNNMKIKDKGIRSVAIIK
jgi:hypothetical protein